MTWQTTNTAKGDNKLYSDAKGVVPSLDLRFASQKNLNDYMTGTPLVDHQRSMSGSNLSPGTFVNSSGLIETAKVNLLTRSQEFNETNWTKSGGGVAAVPSVTANAEIAPDGTLTADRVVFSLNGGTSLSDISDLRQTVVTGTGAYTVSFYIRSFDGTSSYSFLLRDGNGLVSLFNVTGSWQRIEVSSPNYVAGSKFIGFVLRGGTGTSSSADILVWGAQLEEGTTATTYIPTTNATSAAPRFDHDPTTDESLGLLIEESRTNLIAYSQAIGPGNDNFGTNASTVTQNAAVSPDGTTTATSISGDVTYAEVSKAGLTVGAEYTFSFYVKTVTKTSLQFGVSGVAVAVVSVTPNEWNRVSITFTTVAQFAILRFYGAGAPGEPLLVWGAQFELGSFPTSYIPTNGTALTRNADLASITGSNFSSWYNQSEGTVFGNYSSFSYGNATTLPTTAHFTDGTLSNYIRLNSGSAYVVRNFTNTGNVNQSNVTTGGVPASGVSYSFAVGIALNDMAVYANGLSNFDTTYLVPVVNKIQIGNWFTQSNTWLNGTISRLTYFPERLPDATLQAITA